MPGISRRTRVYLEITLRPPGYFVDSLNFAPDFSPDQLSGSGKLASFPRETREKQNGAPNTLWFPWKFPETKSAGDPLVSFLVSGNMYTGQRGGRSCAETTREAGEAARARDRHRRRRRRRLRQRRATRQGMKRGETSLGLSVFFLSFQEKHRQRRNGRGKEEWSTKAVCESYWGDVRLWNKEFWLDDAGLHDALPPNRCALRRHSPPPAESLCPIARSSSDA